MLCYVICTVSPTSTHFTIIPKPVVNSNLCTKQDFPSFSTHSSAYHRCLNSGAGRHNGQLTPQPAAAGHYPTPRWSCDQLNRPPSCLTTQTIPARPACLGLPPMIISSPPCHDRLPASVFLRPRWR